ncbi:MAG: fimbrillin family protein [Rikenellaceae bacterium]
MKTTKISIAILLLAVAACSKYDSDITSDPVGGDTTTTTSVELSFSSSILPATRVTSDQFDTNDAIYVTAFEDGETYASKVEYTYSNSLFTSDSPITYDSVTEDGDEQLLSFIAAYPALDTFAESFSFSANEDQSSAESYEMSDLLIAQTAATNEQIPTLGFEHKMSSLVINITADEIETTGGILKIRAKNEANIDITNDSYSATGSTIEMTPYESDGLSYKIIIAPQTISAGDPVASFEVGDDTYVWYASGDIVFKSGYRRTYNWSLDSENIDLDGNIEGWDDENITDDGDDIYDGTESVWDGTVSLGLAYGSGSAADPYLITTAQQFAYVAQQVSNGNSFYGSYFELKVDIDLNNIGWIPIGNSAGAPFSGTFQGNNKYIKGLYLNNSGSDNQALFGYISHDGTVSNLIVSGAATGNQFVGGIAGYNNGLVENCGSNVTINGTLFAGGVVGYSYDGFVVNCYNAGYVYSTNHSGGIVGYSKGNIANCYNAGNVGNGACYYTAGITGYNEGATITNCYNTGSINGYSGVGGIVGYNGGSTVNCFTLDGSVTYTEDVGTNGTVMSSSEMESADFTSTLNSNAATFNTSNPVAEACSWTTTDGGYPTLDFVVTPFNEGTGSTGDNNEGNEGSEGNTDNTDLLAGYADDGTVSLAGSDYYVISLDDTSYAKISSNVAVDFRSSASTGLWAGYSAATPSGNNAYGIASTTWGCYTVYSNDGWSGLGIVAGSDDFSDLDALTTVTNSPNDYYLHIAIKSEVAVTHMLKFESNNSASYAIGNNGAQVDNLAPSASLTSDGTWYHYDIPVSELTSQGFSFKTGNTTATNVFMIFSGAVDATLDFDAVFFYKK